MYKPKYFKIQELVCPHIYESHRSKAWNFFKKDFLQDLDELREFLGCPIFINDWHLGGEYSRSGLRCPICAKKNTFSTSAHDFGRAVDIRTGAHFSGQLAEKITNNQKLFKSFKRIENTLFTPNWCHIDTLGDHDGIILFSN